MAQERLQEDWLETAVEGIQDFVCGELRSSHARLERPRHSVLSACSRKRSWGKWSPTLHQARLARPKAPLISLRALAAEPDGLLVLTVGGNRSLTRLLLAGKRQEAEDTARRYHDLFGQEHLCIEVQQQLLPDSRWLMQQLIWLAETAGLRTVATNGVHYATRAEYAFYDVLTCTHLKITVDTPHKERPQNDEAYLKSREELAALLAGLPWQHEALQASSEIAATCRYSVLHVS